LSGRGSALDRYARHIVHKINRAIYHVNNTNYVNILYNSSANVLRVLFVQLYCKKAQFSDLKK